MLNTNNHIFKNISAFTHNQKVSTVWEVTSKRQTWKENIRIFSEITKYLKSNKYKYIILNSVGQNQGSKLVVVSRILQL